MATLFISDLHLCASRMEKLALFKKLLSTAAIRADTLYILGDLFEGWAGDDDDTPPHGEVIKALADYTANGGRLFVMRGNRDLLLQHGFVKKTGGRLLADAVRVRLYGEDVLLMHGDTLCTEDRHYQIFRWTVNNVVIRRLFMCAPRSLRIRVWHGFRKLTETSAQQRGAYLLDVYQPTVEKVMRKYRVLRLIHGHTHRQAFHDFKIDEQPAQRIVLGDWITGDNVLVVSKSGYSSMPVGKYVQAT